MMRYEQTPLNQRDPHDRARWSVLRRRLAIG
jgi:hypothetical protein